MRFGSLAAMSAVVVGLSACGDDVSSAARKYCDCVQPVYAEIEKARAAREAGDIGRVIALARAVQERQGEVMACMQDIREEYSGRGPEFQEQVQRQIDERCPRPQL